MMSIIVWWKPAGKLQLAERMVSSVMLRQCVPHRNAQNPLYIRIFIPVMSRKIGEETGSTFFSTPCISNVAITYALPLLLFAVLRALMGAFPYFRLDLDTVPLVLGRPSRSPTPRLPHGTRTPDYRGHRRYI